MIRRAETFSVRNVWCLLSALVAVGCAPRSHPEVGDTNTSWLRDCGSDADCGPGSCLDHVCSLACDVVAPGDVCGRISAAASCEADQRVPQSGRCDVRCTTSSDCGALGTGYTCHVGACRDANAVAAAQGVKDAATVDAAQSAPEIEPNADGSGAVLEPRIEADTTMLSGSISQPEVTSSWLGDHWLIAYRLAKADGYDLLTVQVRRDGTTSPVTRNARSYPEGKVMLEMRIGPDDTVAELLGSSRTPLAAVMGSGVVRFFNHAGATFTDLPFDGTETIWSLAPTQGGDWLVASFRPTEDTLILSANLGRYSPQAMQWSIAPKVVASDAAWGNGAMWLGTHGDDGLLLYHAKEGATFVRVLSGAGAAQPGTLDAGEAQRFDVTLGLRHPLSNPELDNGLRWQVSERAGEPEDWSATALDAPAGQAPLVRFQLGPVGTSEVYAPALKDVELSADGSLVAVCHEDQRFNAGPQKDRLYLTVYSAVGSVRFGPLLLQEGGGVGTCSVSASNDAFLVTWSEPDLLSPRARIVPFPN